MLALLGDIPPTNIPAMAPVTMIIMGTDRGLAGVMQIAGCGRSLHARCRRAGRPAMGRGVAVGPAALQITVALVTMGVDSVTGGRTDQVVPVAHASQSIFHKGKPAKKGMPQVASLFYWGRQTLWLAQ